MKILKNKTYKKLVIERAKYKLFHQIGIYLINRILETTKQLNESVEQGIIKSMQEQGFK